MWRMISVFVLAALLASAAGATGGQEVVGPAALGARGSISGDVQDAQRGIRLMVDSGTIAVTGTGLDVGCAGGESEARRVNGRLQVTCRGRGVRTIVAGREVSFSASGGRLGAVIPPGVTARVSGDIQLCPPRRCMGSRGPAGFPPLGSTPAGGELDVNGDGKVDADDVALLLRK